MASNPDTTRTPPASDWVPKHPTTIYIPWELNSTKPAFFGQSHLVEQLTTILSSPSTLHKYQPFVLQGPTQSGKTALATHTLEEMRKHGKISGVIWLNIGSPTITLATMKNVAHYLKVPTRHCIIPGIVSPRSASEMIDIPIEEDHIFINICEIVEAENSRNRPPVVIVVDNCQEYNNLFQIMAEKFTKIPSLFITQGFDEALHVVSVQRATVPFLAKDASIQMLTSLMESAKTEKIQPIAPSVLQDLVVILQGHPGALTQILTMSTAFSLPLSQILVRLQQISSPNSTHDQILRQTYQLTLDLLHENKSNLDMIHMLAFIDTTGLRMFIKKSENCSQLLGWVMMIQSFLKKYGLLKSSLMEDEEAVALHPMMREIVRQDVIDRDLDAHLIFRTILTTLQPKEVEIKGSVPVIHDAAVLTSALDGRYKPQSIKQFIDEFGALFLQTARKLRQACLFKETKEFTQTCTEAFTLHLGPDAAQTLEMESRFVLTTMDDNDFQAAYDKYPALYTRCEKTLGSEHTLTLALSIKIISLLNNLKRAPEAASLAETLITKMTTKHGKLHPETVRVNILLGEILLQIAGKAEQANKILSEAFAFNLSKTCGMRKSVKLNFCFQIEASKIANDKSNLQVFETFVRRASALITVMRDELGNENHKNILIAWTSLAIACDKMDGLQYGSMMIHCHVLKQMEIMLGKEHPLSQAQTGVAQASVVALFSKLGM